MWREEKWKRLLVSRGLASSPAHTEIHHNIERLLEHFHLIVTPELPGRVLVERSVTVCKRETKREIKRVAKLDCRGGSVVNAALKDGSARLEHARAQLTRRRRPPERAAP